jgi:hypothetical protein
MFTTNVGVPVSLLTTKCLFASGATNLYASIVSAKTRLRHSFVNFVLILNPNPKPIRERIDVADTKSVLSALQLFKLSHLCSRTRRSSGITRATTASGTRLQWG